MLLKYLSLYCHNYVIINKQFYKFHNNRLLNRFLFLGQWYEASIKKE